MDSHVRRIATGGGIYSRLARRRGEVAGRGSSALKPRCFSRRDGSSRPPNNGNNNNNDKGTSLIHLTQEEEAAAVLNSQYAASSSADILVEIRAGPCLSPHVLTYSKNQFRLDLFGLRFRLGPVL